MNFAKKIINLIKENPFQSILIFLLFMIFIFNLNRNKINLDDKLTINDAVHIFIQPSCSHCHSLQNFIKTIKNKEKYNFQYHDITTSQGFDTLTKMLALKNIKLSQIGTPMVITDKDYIIGFVDNEEGQKEFINLINKAEIKIQEQKTKFDLPIFGEVEFKNLSLPILAIVVGLADGFNPCAMWVLVYLISIALTLKDKKKLIILVGIFLLTSGILYFLFMTAWLNVFLLVGIIATLNLIIGLFALYYGINSIYEFIKAKGYIECKLSNNKTRQQSMSKIRELMKEKLTISVIFGIIILAFVVNSIEFLCSAALPATFTYILTQSNLSIISYYLYILLYTLMFMLDDLIVFSCAIFAVNKYSGEKYEKYSTLIGGITMCAIGILVVFFPSLLK